MNHSHLAPPTSAAITAAILALVLLSTACNEEPFDERREPGADVSSGEPDAGSAGDAHWADDVGNTGDAGHVPDGDLSSDVDAGRHEDEEPAAPVINLADGIELVGIEAFQTIETTLLEGGSPVDSATPLIAGRDTLFRLLVSVDQDWTPRELTAEILLTDTDTGESELVTATRNVSTGSAPGDRASAFEVRVPRELLRTQTRASFRLVGEGGTSVESVETHSARWPRDGSSMDLGARDSTGTLHLVLVPMRFDSDGSGRLPDTSPEQLARFESLLRAIYPFHELRLEVREAISWTGAVRWGNFNTTLRALKQSDGAEHAYYYGLINPKETYAEHCSGGCTTGQSFTVSSAESTSYRVGSGVGFSGESTAWTMIHELGHMHGRGHAPCGVSFWSRDSSYPHAGGITGVRGWDGRDDTIFGPSEVTDFMGYCNDTWVSDYTYLGLIERMQEANALERVAGFSMPTRWRYASWSDDHEPAWGEHTIETNPGTGQWASATFLDAQDAMLARVEVPYIVSAHEGERSVLIPEPPHSAVRLQVDAPSKSFGLPIF